MATVASGASPLAKVRLATHRFSGNGLGRTTVWFQRGPSIENIACSLTLRVGHELSKSPENARLGESSYGVYERQHDLLFAEVFVRYRQELPSLVAYWVGEEALPKAEYGVKNPDAFLIDDELQPRRVIESAGAYSQQQVETFHEYCRLARLPYELW